MNKTKLDAQGQGRQGHEKLNRNLLTGVWGIKCRGGGALKQVQCLGRFFIENIDYLLEVIVYYIKNNENNSLQNKYNLWECPFVKISHCFDCGFVETRVCGLFLDYVEK